MTKSYEAALNECISYNEQHTQTFKSLCIVPVGLFGSFHAAGAINFSLIEMNSCTDLDQRSVCGGEEEIKSVRT